MRLPDFFTGRSRRLLGILLGILVLTSTIGAPIGGAAAGAYTSPQYQCSATDRALYQITGGFINPQCNYINGSLTISELRQQQLNVTKTNIAQAASETISNRNSYQTTQNNSESNLQTTLFAYGQNAQINSIQNGSSVTATNTNVNTSLDDRVSKMQVNTISAYNQYLEQLRTLASKQYNTSINMLDIQTTYGSKKLKPSDFNYHNITLANGTTKQDLNITVNYSGNSAVYHYTLWGQALFVSGGSTSGSGLKILVKSTSSTNAHVFISQSESEQNTLGTTIKGNSRFAPKTKWTHLFNELNRKDKQTKSNLVKSTQSDKNCYTSGSCNLTQRIDPITAAQEASTNYNTTGYYSYALSSAAYSGYSVNGINSSTVTVLTSTGISYTGGLMSSKAPPNGTWRVGTTYNATNLPGIQFIATTGGTIHQFHHTFTITGMKNRNGTAINSTQDRRYQIQTYNASQYIKLQQELNSLRQTIRANAPTSSGGTSSSSGGLLSGVSTTTEALVALGALAVLLLSQRGGAG